MYLPDGKKSTSWLNERRRRVVRVKFQWIGGAPEGIRTPDLCLRRAALYPAELRARRGFMYRRLREAAIARCLKGEKAREFVQQKPRPFNLRLSLPSLVGQQQSCRVQPSRPG